MQKQSIDDRLDRFFAFLRSIPPAAWIFLAFFGVMLVQHRFIYIYLDDYAYATLMFAVKPSTPVVGHAFTLPQLGEFLYLHYLHWGGRILCFIMQIGLTRFGFWPFRIAQAVMLTGVLVTTYQVLQIHEPRPKNRALTALLLCCCFGFISLQVHRQGTYWASASIAYVWPFAFLYAAGSIHARLEEWKGRTPLVLMGLLYFAAGFSQEQLGLVAVLFVLGMAVMHLRQKREKRALITDAAALACVLAGYSILMLAPGNFERATFHAYEYFAGLSLMEKIRSNLPHVLSLIVGKHNQALMVLWAWVSTAVQRSGYRARKQPGMLYLGLYILCFSYAVLLSVIAIPPLTAQIKILFEPGFNKSYLLFWIGFLVANSLACLLFCLDQKKEVLLFVFLGALVSQAGMIFSPALTLRSSLVFLFAFFPVLTAMGVFVLTQALRWNRLARAALVVVVAVAVLNTGFLIGGYARNGKDMDANDRTLQQAAEAIHQGAEVQQVKLRKLTDESFAAEVPYAQGYEYINIWMKAYYNIPQDVDLVWE